MNQILYLYGVERTPIFIAILYAIYYSFRARLKEGGRLNCSYSERHIKLMNQLLSKDLTPYFFTKKQVVKFLNTSIATYDRKVRAGKAPKGRHLYGSQRVFFPVSDIILFAEGNWEGAQ